MSKLEGMLADSSRVVSVSPELDLSLPDDINAVNVNTNLDDCLSAPFPVCG